MFESIQADKALVQLIARETPPILDVRSEGEFAESHVPGFTNIPILDNSERHQVGLTYKNEGNEAAVKLGYALFNPHREERLNAWKNLAREKQIWVSCWRGGLRSKLACQFLEESKANPVQIVGGYKALRAQIKAPLKNPPSMFVLSGMTGNGKTDLLERITHSVIDLEALAHHRGSAFGSHIGCAQPTQAQFENELGLAVHRNPQGFVVEDESLRIGNIFLATEFKEKMNASPTLLLNATLEERSVRVFNGYVKTPLEKGMEPSIVQNSFQAALARIRPKLGGLLHDQILKSMQDAFSGELTPDRHSAWIESLLLHYYDGLYQFSLQRKPRTFIFQGNFQECLEWLQQNLPKKSA